MTATREPGAPTRILVAGVGNIFLGDDGFGVAVAQRLAAECVPDGVEVVDFGIRGLDLAFALLDGYDGLVLVDAVPRGGAPGTLYVIEPDLADMGPEEGAVAGRGGLDGHSMDPVKVLAFARTLGAPPIPTLVVGCEPGATDGSEDGSDDAELRMELSAPVRAAVDRAAELVVTLVADLRRDRVRSV